MPSRMNWRQQLRQTPAAECLRKGTVAQFPLNDILLLTKTFLENSPAWFFGTGPEPFTDQAETILLRELDEVRGQLRHYEVALLATTQALRRNTIRALLVDLAPLGTPPDELFEDTVAIYLQCLILAQRSAPLLVDDEECRAAEELLALIKAWRRKAWETFPSITTALQVCVRGGLDDVIPSSMVRALILRNGYAKMFQTEVEHLQRDCKWARLHDMVSSIPRPEDHPTMRDILPLIVTPGECLGLWHWRPNRERIVLWEQHLSNDQRAEAIAILRLEGPDDSPQERRTMRESGPGSFVQFSGLVSHEVAPLLDHLVSAFDRAIMSGPSSLQWLLSECAAHPHIRAPDALRQSLVELEAAMDLGADDSVGTLSRFVQSLRTNMDLIERMEAMSAALPFIGASPRLQSACGHRHEVDSQAKRLLKEAQDHFQGMLEQDRPDRIFALRLQSLAQVMFKSDWLRFVWDPGFVGMLGQMPSEDDINRAIDIIGGLAPSPHPSSKQDLKNFLSAKLCGRRITGADGNSRISILLRPTPSVAPTPPEQPKPNTWLTKTLEPNRTLLRKKLLSIPNIDSELVATCLEKVKERTDDNFVSDLNNKLLLSEAPQRRRDTDEEEEKEANEECPFTDQVCVNITNLFAPNAPNAIPRPIRSLPKCWPQVLLHMMRQRPRGMLDRLGQSMPRESWTKWHKNLETLFDKSHLDEEGGLGFTKAAIDVWTRRQAVLARHVSTHSLPARIREQVNEFSDVIPRASSSSERRVNAMHRRSTSGTLRLPRRDRY